MTIDRDLHWPMSCPFCGAFPNMAPTRNREGLSMTAMLCTGCGAKGPPKMLPGDAAKAWDEVKFRRRMTERDLGGPPDDDPEPKPSPVKPKLPEMV